MTTKSTTKRTTATDENTKWFQRGFTSKEHYQGFLQFNDLIDESYGFDDVYHDQYTGKTIRISASEVEKTAKEIELENKATEFLEAHQQ